MVVPSTVFAIVLLALLSSTAVDPATYVGNVYGSAPPGATVVLADDAGAVVRSAIADADGRFLINNVPAPDEGRDYVLIAGSLQQKVRVLPGAVMALEVHATESEVETHYRHEAAAFAKAGAESFRGMVFATREGLVGGTTANGHVIVTNDRFAALPSKRALSTNFGHEREVRVTYRGRTTTVPVWDIGPWNTHDDYWNPPNIRETFKDLPMGLPEAEAAFTAKYNGGLDGFGRVVKNPAGIDLADGTFWIDLAMTNNDRVEVEYLWVDSAGPESSSIAKAATFASSVTIEAVADDAASGDAPIAGAELFVGAPGESGSGVPMLPADGAFDSPHELLRTTFVPAASGEQTIYVHARDVYGNWGAFAAAAVSLPLQPRRRSARH